MAPKVIENQQYSIKSDVYSYALIINQLFTNEIPYSNLNSNQQIIDEITNNRLPQIYQHNNWNIRPIIDKCLKKDPAQRPSFNDIYNELMQIFGSSSYKRFTDKYLYKIESQINCPIVFYRILKIIFYNFARALMINNFKEMINKVKKAEKTVDEGKNCRLWLCG